MEILRTEIVLEEDSAMVWLRISFVGFFWWLRMSFLWLKIYLFLNDVTFLSRVARVGSLSVRKLSLVQLWTKKTTFCLKLLMLPKSAYFAIHLAFATHQPMFPFISKILRHNRVYVETNCFLSFRNFSASTAFTLSDICHPVSA